MAIKKRTGFEGGLWIIPLVLFLASIYSIFFRAIPQWKSGSCSWQMVDNVKTWVCDDEKVSFLSIGATWFGIILFCAAIGSALKMRSER